MLPAKNRLNLSQDAKNRFLAGQKLSSDDFRVLAKARANVFKIAIIVSKKVAKKAVDRNRIKRVVSEALRNQPVFKGELLIVIKKNIADLKKNEVQSKLFVLLNKLK